MKKIKLLIVLLLYIEVMFSQIPTYKETKLQEFQVASYDSTHNFCFNYHQTLIKKGAGKKHRGNLSLENAKKDIFKYLNKEIFFPKQTIKYNPAFYYDDRKMEKNKVELGIEGYYTIYKIDTLSNVFNNLTLHLKDSSGNTSYITRHVNNFSFYPPQGRGIPFFILTDYYKYLVSNYVGNIYVDKYLSLAVISVEDCSYVISGFEIVNCYSPYLACILINNKSERKKINVDKLENELKWNYLTLEKYNAKRKRKEEKDSLEQVQERKEAQWYATRDSLREEEYEKKRLQASLKYDVNYIKKTHPEWTLQDCKRIADKQIWIGMHIEMVIYMRGLPQKINSSNYGRGNEHQYFWSGYNSNHFYVKDNGVVYSWN